jgi:hypothetical protein
MTNGKKRKGSLLLFAGAIACLTSYFLFVKQAQPVSGRQLRASALSQDKKQQEKERKRESFKSGRDLLLKRGLPFDPDMLLEPGWKKTLAPALALIPEIREVRQLDKKLEGVQLADTLVLPETIELSGDTVIIARQLVFSGKHVVIKGPHDLHIFPMEPFLSSDAGLQARSSRGSKSSVKSAHVLSESLRLAKQQGRLVQPESITINLDGLGRDQWLEQQRAKALLKGKGHHATRAMLQAENIDKGPGATGAGGEAFRGEPGVTPAQTGPGATGNCATNPDGLQGIVGNDGTDAGTGRTALIGVDGADGGILNFTIPNHTTTMSYDFSARGGRGGQGGTGGPGGFAAIGGQGGPGGPGKLCDCGIGNPVHSGNGGRGGTGGVGGRGGIGGIGGPGANGGNGGEIHITTPCDWSGSYSTDVNAGLRGPGGNPGQYSSGRVGGPGGGGGPGATNVLCPSLGGSTGATGTTGAPGSHGLFDGDAGPNGERGDHDGPTPTVTIDETDCQQFSCPEHCFPYNQLDEGGCWTAVDYCSYEWGCPFGTTDGGQGCCCGPTPVLIDVLGSKARR